MLRASRFIDTERNGNGMNGDEEMERNGGGGGGGYVAPIAAPPETRREEIEPERNGEEDVEIYRPDPIVQTKPIPIYVPPKPPRPPIFVEPEPEPEPEMPIDIAIVEDVPITPEVIELPLPILPDIVPYPLPPDIVAEKPPLQIIEPIPVDESDELSAGDLALVSIGIIPDGEQSIADAIHAPTVIPTELAGFEEPPATAQIAGRGLLWLVLVGVFAVGVLKLFPEP